MRARLVQLAVDGKLEHSEAKLAGFTQHKAQKAAAELLDAEDDDEDCVMMS